MEMTDLKRRKNKNGQGGIYHHKNRKWYGRCTDPSTKKMRYTSYYETKTEARKALNTLIYELEHNTYIDKNNATLIQLAREYVNDQVKSGEICANTLGTKRGNIKRIEKMSIANIPIQKVNVNQIKNCLYEMRIYSQSIIDKDYQSIKKSFELAVTNEILSKNPFDSNLKLKKPKSEKKMKKVENFTIDEQNQILGAIASSDIDLKFKIIVLLGLHTGMRCGEICALRPSDIDSRGKVIIVNRTTTRDEKGHVTLHKEDTTKTENSRRETPINQEVENYLKIAKSSFKFNPNQLLFCTNELGIITDGMVNDNFKRLCKQAGIEKTVNFHMLRHTFISNCVEGGMPISTLQKIVGHKSIKTTIDVYTQIPNDKKKEDFEKQTNYLLEKGLTSNIL